MMSQIEPMVPTAQDQNSQCSKSNQPMLSATKQGIEPAAAEPPKVAKAPRKKKAASSEAEKPKTKKAKTTHADTKATTAGSDSGSSDDLEVEVPDEPSPLPPSRPSDPEGAAEYDALKAVWSPRNKRPDVQMVKNSLVAFKDVVKSIRDEWKAQSQSMKEAENKSELEKSTEFKKQVILQRRLMEIVMNTTLERGHPVIIEKYVIKFSFPFPPPFGYYHHNYRCAEQIQDNCFLSIFIRCCFKHCSLNS